MAFIGFPTDPNQDPDAGTTSPPPAAEGVVRSFVEHWGEMARAWGINPTMGELFALLYLTGADWDAEGLRTSLGVSRGNVSMNLRELITWGLVHKVRHAGERREYYRAEANVWTLFQRILRERKRRELDPTLAVLGTSVRSGSMALDDPLIRARLIEIQRFCTLIDAVANQILALKEVDLEGLSRLLEEETPS